MTWVTMPRTRVPGARRKRCLATSGDVSVGFTAATAYAARRTARDIGATELRVLRRWGDVVLIEAGVDTYREEGR